MTGYPDKARAILKTRSVKKLKRDWREAYRQGLDRVDGANDARRFITMELLTRLSWAEVGTFERTEIAAIKAQDSPEGRAA
jgi:hypothetical protein